MATRRKALFGSYTTRLAVVGMLVLIGALVVASVAQAAVSISRAELNGTQLRIEGQASPNHTITVDGVAMGTSDGSGKFRIDRSGFTAPADCTITSGNGSGSCSAFFPVGTIVRLDARPAANSSFQGWRGLPGCSDPSKIRVARGTTINCQPGFSLK